MKREWLINVEGWEYLVSQIKEGSLGSVGLVCIRASEPPFPSGTGENAINMFKEKWLRDIKSLFGEPDSFTSLDSHKALSMVMKYSHGPIVRVFADWSENRSFCDIEAVGTETAIIYRPGVNLLASIKGEQL